ncbi:hypothetical protein BT69DRAFT_438282 [Atractiella rhizophila]|nr:hypothetical protein BT69DRAFT_438282 [Atractiella rhizophila]
MEKRHLRIQVLHSALPAPIGISTTGISVSSPGPQVSPTTTRLSSALSSMLEKPSSSSMSNIPVVSTTATTSITPVMSNGTFGEDGIGIVNAGTGGASAVATMQNLLGMTAGGTIRGRPAGLRADGGGITHGMNIRRDPSPFHNHNADSTPISMSPHDPPMFTNQGYGADSSDFYEQQARRQSFSSNGRSVSPAARIESLKSGYQVPVGAQMYNSNGLSISPPNPTPINLGSQAPMSSNIFSTSPFSAPGQKSLFFSQSYEGHDESRFAGRSLPVLDEIHQRQQIKTGMLRSPFDSDDDEDLEFVPSSLSELLTVEEMHRRTARQSFGQQSGLLRRPNGTGMNGGGQSSAGGAGSFDPFDQPLSRSVPLDSMLFNRQVGSGSNGMTGMIGLGDDMGRTSTNPNVVGSQRPSLLQQTSNPTYTPSHLTLQQQLLRGMAPSGGVNGNTNYGVNDYRSYMDSRHEVDELSLANIISPGRARTLRDHAPGSSLPQGLAAGLSRLHLTPAQHTGETPPSSFSQSGYVHPVLSPTSPTSLDPNNPRTSNFSPQSWGSDPPSPHGFNAIGGGANPPGLKLPSSYSRRMGGGGYQFTSPLSKPGKNYEDSKDSLGPSSLVSPSQAGLSSPKHSLFDDGIFDMDGINA